MMLDLCKLTHWFLHSLSKLKKNAMPYGNLICEFRKRSFLFYVTQGCSALVCSVHQVWFFPRFGTLFDSFTPTVLNNYTVNHRKLKRLNLFSNRFGFEEVQDAKLYWFFHIPNRKGGWKVLASMMMMMIIHYYCTSTISSSGSRLLIAQNWFHSFLKVQ